MDTTSDEGFWNGLWAAAPRISMIVAACAFLWGVVTFSTGGIRPQSQIDLENLKEKQTSLGSRVAVCESRLDQMPRTQDIADWTAHFSRLDAVFEGQRELVTQEKYDIKDLFSKYQALTTAPPRK
jgi:hypothetical protein